MSIRVLTPFGAARLVEKYVEAAIKNLTSPIDVSTQAGRQLTSLLSQLKPLRAQWEADGPVHDAAGRAARFDEVYRLFLAANVGNLLTSASEVVSSTSTRSVLTAMDVVDPSGAASGIKRSNQQAFVAESATASRTKRRAKSTEAGKLRSKRAAKNQLKLMQLLMRMADERAEAARAEKRRKLDARILARLLQDDR